jgi:GntR family transcriptional regulator, transcriptional repressor for pyruvate dehydrogenase complex
VSNVPIKSNPEGTKDSLHLGPSLSEQVTEKLRAQILGGNYEVGQGLPSEQEIGNAFGVSRSVVREAISRLKADQLVITRQGRGAFVAATASPLGFQISNEGSKKIQGTRHILELRMGLEVEAAGLAAVNRRPSHLEDMTKALENMRDATDEMAIDRLVLADLRFHRAICIASSNPHFVAFFDFLEPHLHYAITQTRLRSSKRPQRLDDAQREHEMIYFSIERRNAEAARAAARQHVSNTLERLATAADVNDDLYQISEGMTRLGIERSR